MPKAALFASLGALLAVPAYASDAPLESSSSASATVTVYIAPIGSALQARAQGAVGLWSISGQHDGIMISIAEAGGFMQSVDIYSRQTSGIELYWDTKPRAVQAPGASKSIGLVKNHFVVPEDMPLISTFIISSI